MTIPVLADRQRGRAFPLWALLIAVALGGLTLGLVARTLDRQRRTRIAAARVREVGVAVQAFLGEYVTQVDPSVRVIQAGIVPGTSSGPRLHQRIAQVAGVVPDLREASSSGWALLADGVAVDCEADASASAVVTIRYRRSIYADRLVASLVERCNRGGWTHRVFVSPRATIPTASDSRDPRATFVLACLGSMAIDLGPISRHEVRWDGRRWAVAYHYRRRSTATIDGPAWVEVSGGDYALDESPLNICWGGGPEIAEAVARISASCEQRGWAVESVDGPPSSPAARQPAGPRPEVAADP